MNSILGCVTLLAIGSAIRVVVTRGGKGQILLTTIYRICYLGAVLLALFTILCTQVSANTNNGFITTETSDIQVDNSGIFELESETFNAEYIIDEDTTTTSLEEFMKNKRQCGIYIRKNDTIVYHRHLGSVESIDASEILSIYDSWKKNGTVPRENTRYWLMGVFYFDY